MEWFNPHCNQWLKNKFEIYKELRKRDKAYFSEKYQMYIITKYDDVLFALSNPDIFSSAKGNLIVEDPDRFGKTLGASDGEMHQYLKNIAKNAYSKDNIERIIDSLKKYADQLLPVNPIINFSDIINNLSSFVTSEIIGLPEDKIKIKDIVVEIQNKDHRSIYTDDKSDVYYNKFLTILALHLVKEKTFPIQNGIYKEYFEHILYHQPEHIYRSLFTGPVISGTSSMSAALQFLTIDLYENNLINSDVKNKNLILNIINESLRYRPSTSRFSRTVAQKVTLHGVELTPGDRVALCLDSSSRDNEKFNNADQFNIDRNTAGKLSFGHGVHACIALSISKAVMEAYLEVFLDTFKKYKLITTPEEYEFLITASGNNDMISNLIAEKI
jgi:cytochrome P450